MSYLEKHELDALLEAPDTSTPQVRRERALLLFLYHTGARVSEAAHLKVGALQLADKNADHSRVTLLGKGGKTRLCPLLRETAQALMRCRNPAWPWLRNGIEAVQRITRNSP